jgi:heme/copper-type cytochrome/quinol oxidase subunit 1
MTRTSWLVGGVGVLLLVAGVGVFALANAAGAGDVGWAAYAPLEPDAYSSQLTLTFSDGAVLWTGQHAVGAGLVVLGLLVLVGLGGWLLGRRSAL